MKKENILVSICCITYNHQKFIRQCLAGFVMQKTDFKFEILVHEDASTDQTANIIREYEKKHPDLFRCVYQTVNQFAIQNTLTNILFPMAKGKYIALCEGDDYWTDIYKLQKQVNFLEKNEDFAICFHNVEEKTEDEDTPSFLYCKQNQKLVCTKNDLAFHNFMPTCSVVYRNHLYKDLPVWFGSQPIGDWILHIINAQYGKIKYLPKVMGVHRIHKGGIWSYQDIKVSIQLLLKIYDVLVTHFTDDIEFVENLKKGKAAMQEVLNSKNKQFQIENTKEKVSSFFIYNGIKKIIKNILPYGLVKLLQRKNDTKN